MDAEPTFPREFWLAPATCLQERTGTCLTTCPYSCCEGVSLNVPLWVLFSVQVIKSGNFIKIRSVLLNHLEFP